MLLGPRERNLLVSHIGQPYKTWSPSRQVREDQRIANEPTPPSRETARRTNSPTPFPRVHRKNLSRNTLAEYDLTWDWDDVSQPSLPPLVYWFVCVEQG